MENVETIVESPRDDRVENLREDEYVEDQGLDNSVVFFLKRSVSFVVESENLGTKEMEDESDGCLIERLTKDLLVHVDGKERGGFLIRFAIQQSR